MTSTTMIAQTAPTTTPPTITLDDVLRALMETRNTIEANAEAVRIRFEQEAKIRAEEARIRAEKHAKREAEEAKIRSEEARIRAEEARIRAEEKVETQKRLEENNKRSKEWDRRLGALGNRLGDFVQEMVRPAAVRLFQERNLPVHYVSPNVVAYDDNGQFVMEIDLMVINSETLIAIECKSNLSHDDVKEHLERLDVFKQYFSQYANYTILGAVAGMVIPVEVSRYAHKKGLYVLAQSGEAVEIRNPDGFEARKW